MIKLLRISREKKPQCKSTLNNDVLSSTVPISRLILSNNDAFTRNCVKTKNCFPVRHEQRHIDISSSNICLRKMSKSTHQQCLSRTSFHLDYRNGKIIRWKLTEFCDKEKCLVCNIRQADSRPSFLCCGGWYVIKWPFPGAEKMPLFDV